MVAEANSLEIAQRMLRAGMSLEQVAEFTELPMETLIRLEGGHNCMGA